jgi:hypothetical protein
MSNRDAFFSNVNWSLYIINFELIRAHSFADGLLLPQNILFLLYIYLHVVLSSVFLVGTRKCVLKWYVHSDEVK